jgi:hypothetical protein
MKQLNYYKTKNSPSVVDFKWFKVLNIVFLTMLALYGLFNF